MTINTELRFCAERQRTEQILHSRILLLVRTANIPIIERDNTNSRDQHQGDHCFELHHCICEEWIKAAAPSAAVARIEPQ